MKRSDVYQELSLLTVSSGSVKQERYRVVSEERLRLFLNRRPLVEMQYLPGKEKELGVGFLRSTDLIRSKDQIHSLTWDSRNFNLLVEAEVSREQTEDFLRHLTFGSGCGLSLADKGSSAMKVLRTDTHFNRGLIRKNLLGFLSESHASRMVRGIHCAALYQEEKEICQADDIGRHNAVDKVLGKCFLEGADLSRMMLLTTGRLTFEVILKAIRHGVPLVATRSIASTMALSLAEKSRICLVGALRGETFTVFSAPYRISPS